MRHERHILKTVIDNQKNTLGTRLEALRGIIKFDQVFPPYMECNYTACRNLIPINQILCTEHRSYKKTIKQKRHVKKI